MEPTTDASVGGLEFHEGKGNVYEPSELTLVGSHPGLPPHCLLADVLPVARKTTSRCLVGKRKVRVVRVACDWILLRTHVGGTDFHELMPVDLQLQFGSSPSDQYPLRDMGPFRKPLASLDRSVNRIRFAR